MRTRYRLHLIPHPRLEEHRPTSSIEEVGVLTACGRVLVQGEQLGDVTGPHNMGSGVQSLYAERAVG